MSLLPHPHPWLICILEGRPQHIVRIAAHELLHLVERLTTRDGVPITTATEEVRANLVGRLFELFFNDYCQRFYATATQLHGAVR